MFEFIKAIFLLIFYIMLGIIGAAALFAFMSSYGMGILSTIWNDPVLLIITSFIIGAIIGLFNIKREEKD